jgi:tRNA threonylcarbamoyladenosine modification (KEOPS) complex  Pcc1 subunit
MTLRASGWSATVTVTTAGRPGLARWIARVLSPEAARELPRAEATVRTPRRGVLAITVHAADAGAMRAALNTYLGWVSLSLATADTAGTGRSEPPAPS